MRMNAASIRKPMNYMLCAMIELTANLRLFARLKTEQPNALTVKNCKGVRFYDVGLAAAAESRNISEKLLGCYSPFELSTGVKSHLAISGSKIVYAAQAAIAALAFCQPLPATAHGHCPGGNKPARICNQTGSSCYCGSVPVLVPHSIGAHACCGSG